MLTYCKTICVMDLGFFLYIQNHHQMTAQKIHVWSERKFQSLILQELQKKKKIFRFNRWDVLDEQVSWPEIQVLVKTEEFDQTLIKKIYNMVAFVVWS